MSERCHTDGELAALVSVADGDPRRAHVASCPRCRVRLAEYHAFLSAPAEVPSAELRDAEERLGGRLAREVAGIASRRADGPTFADRMRAWWRSPVAGPALAFAALVAVAGGVALVALMRVPAPGGARPDTVMRGAATPEVRLATPQRPPGGGVRLAWSSLPGADTYEMVLYSSALDEVARQSAGRDTALALAPERLVALGRGDTLLVRVIALRAGAPLAESRLEPLIAR